MRPETESARARRYLLDDASDLESSALEDQYFDDDDAVDRIAAAEDDLIEEYLANELGAVERERFERVYLPVPHRRRRVETVRHLMVAASGSPAAAIPPTAPPWRAAFPVQCLALAAALVLAAGGALWVFAPAREPAAGARTQPSTASIPPEAATAPLPGAAAPRLFAASISPVTVRSAAASPSVVIPAGTEILALSLEGGADGRNLVPGRASIRSINGGSIWEGLAVGGGRPPGVIARLDVPAARLRADDYVVTLFGTDPAGVEREWSRYFLRVRADRGEKRP